jgi:hypothetical protein
MTDYDSLEDIPGIGPAIAENLRAAGLDSADAVLAADAGELADVELIGESTAEAILNGEADGRRGRDPDVREHLDAVCEQARKPLSDRDAIARSPIGWSTHKEWRNKDGEPYATYQEEWRNARAVGRERLIDEGLYGEADSSLVKYLIKCSDAGYDDEQTIKHEGDADLGGSTTVVLDSEYVDSE